MKRASPALIGFSALCALAFGAVPAPAADKLPLKLTLEWKYTGPTSFFLLARDRGYYAQEGLDVTIDAGQGSEAALTRVASGAYDIGFSDINSMVAFKVAHPDQAMKVVMIAYDAAPYAACAIKGRGIQTAKDLAGKTMGAPVFEDAMHFFPNFAEAVGFDPATVKNQNLAPALRAQMLVQKKVDFITALSFGCIVELEAAGIPRSDILVFQYSDYGLPFYGNALAAPDRLLSAHPEAVKGFIRATIKGMRAMIADNKASLAALTQQDPLTSQAVELERMQLAIKMNILTPWVEQNGVGEATDARLKQSIADVVRSLKLARTPVPDQIFTDAFLPPEKDRLLK